MAIYGIGAYYKGENKDMTDEFISDGYACIGWEKDDAPAIHRLFNKIEDGDIIYIKSNPAQLGLYIKAIGIVTKNKTEDIPHLGQVCLPVKWIWSGKKKIGKVKDKYHVRSITLYEEQNPKIRKNIIKLLLSKL